MKNFKYALPTLLIVAASLSACGGGGGNSTPTTTTPTTPVAQTCANGASDYPTCTPPYIAADLQLSVDAPPFSDGSEDLKAFNYLNDLRSSLGLGKLRYSAELTKAASNHANYLFLNKILTHFETESLAGFTGINPADRALFAGYNSLFIGEGISLGTSKTNAIEAQLHSVYHRSTLLNQSMRDIGVGSYDLEGTISTIVSIGYKTPQRNASDFIMTYPKNNQTNIPLGICNESPWAFPEIKVEEACTNPRNVNGLIVYDMKVGYPISIAVESRNELKVIKFQLFEAGSNTPIDAWLLTTLNSPTPIPKHEAYLTAKGGLKPNTKYEVLFTGTSNNSFFEKNWSFITGAN